MMIWFTGKKARVDYAEQSKNLIIHFSKDNNPILMEILNATEFFRDTTRKLPRNMRKQIPLNA